MSGRHRLSSSPPFHSTLYFQCSCILSATLPFILGSPQNTFERGAVYLRTRSSVEHWRLSRMMLVLAMVRMMSVESQLCVCPHYVPIQKKRDMKSLLNTRFLLINVVIRRL